MAADERPQPDGVTAIKGIGKAKARILDEGLGIQTLDALASSSIDDLEAAFADANRPMARAALEDWRHQARSLVGPTMATATVDPGSPAGPGLPDNPGRDVSADRSARRKERNHTKPFGGKTMATGTIEIPPLPLNGSIEAALFESGGANPVNVIRTTQNWEVRTRVELSGPLSQFIGGSWHVHVRLESMGPGGEFSFFDIDSNVAIPEADDTYEQILNVPAGSVTAAHDGTPYRVVVVVTYRGPLGNPGPIAGYVDLGLVMFYNPA